MQTARAFSLCRGKVATAPTWPSTPLPPRLLAHLNSKPRGRISATSLHIIYAKMKPRNLILRKARDTLAVHEGAKMAIEVSNNHFTAMILNGKMLE